MQHFFSPHSSSCIPASCLFNLAHRPLLAQRGQIWAVAQWRGRALPVTCLVLNQSVSLVLQIYTHYYTYNIRFIKYPQHALYLSFCVPLL